MGLRGTFVAYSVLAFHIGQPTILFFFLPLPTGRKINGILKKRIVLYMRHQVAMHNQK